MRAALAGLTNQRGRTIAVLGDMLELGADTQAFHAGLAPDCEHIDRVMAVGECMRTLYDALRPDQRWVWQSAADDELLETLVAGLRASDRVLIKGSNRVFWTLQFAGKLQERLKDQ